LIKSNHRALRKNEVDTYGAPNFAPDYSATVLAAKKSVNSSKHSFFVYYFLCVRDIKNLENVNKRGRKKSFRKSFF
jgi:hypothetical protein